MQQLQFIGISPEQLQTAIIEGVQIQLNELKKNFEPKAPTQYYSRAQVCKKLGICQATLHNWVTQKKIPCYGLGGKIFFKSEDIDNAIVQLNK